MDTITAIKTRRSIRRFKEDKISHELLEDIISATSFAPSWKNTQVSRYIAVENEEIKNKIATEYSPEYNREIILTAPMLLAVSVVKSRSGYERDGTFSTEKGKGWQMFDCGIASQTLSLAAHEYGLGTVIMGLFDIEACTKLLEIPAEQELVTLIAIGYADISPVAPKRKEVDILLRYIE